MSDELSQYLTSEQGRKYAKLSPEALELMGKEAANRLLNDGIPLNESISKLAGAHDSINADQIKRVCEFANQSVYLAAHDKAKTAGANSSYPQFDLADAGRVIQELSDGARPTVTTSVDLEYSRLPRSNKSKLSSADEDRMLEEAFGLMGKEALVDYDRNSVVAEVDTLRRDLEDLQSHLSDVKATFVTMKTAAMNEFYELTRQHLLEGQDFAQVLAAARSSDAPATKVASALKPVVTRLLKEKIASAQRLKAGTDGLDKIAHRVLNEKHPLVTSFRAALSLGDEVEKVSTSLEDVEARLGEVKAFIRKERLGA